MSEIVRIVNVNKYFGKLHVLRDLNLRVDKGEVVSIIGPSGAGKSTILRCINYLEPINSGKIYFEGQYFDPQKENIYQYRVNFGFVFQRFNLFPHLSVIENLTLAPRIILKKSKKEAEETAEILLNKVSLADKKNAYPKELSGGQQQRVAIARAMSTNPKVMLLDEITSALDPEISGEVLKVIYDLAERGMTMIMVTHEISFARKISKRIIFFENGSVVEEGPSQEFFQRPKNKRTKDFLNSVLD